MYFLKSRHITMNMLHADAHIYQNYRSVTMAKKIRSIPTLGKLILLADYIGISLEELCDPRIRVTDVQLPEPFPVREWLKHKFSDDRIELYKNLAMKDTETILNGGDPVISDLPEE